MAALKRMSARDRGKIVQVGSALAYRAIPLQAAYCGAKFGIRGLHRLDPHRAAARQEQGADHDGAAARREHDAVQLVSLEAADAPDAGAADLPARDPGRGGLLGGAPPPPRAVGRLQRRAGDPRQQARPQLRRPVPGAGPASTASRSRTCRSTASGPATCTSRSQGEAATHGIFDAQAKTRSPQLWAATHRRLLARRAGRRSRPWARRRVRRLTRGDGAERADRGPTPRTCCASMRCSPTASAASSSGPRGDFAWMCFPRWDSGAVFSSLIGGCGRLRDHPARPLRVGRLLRARQPDLAQPLGHRRRDDRVPRGARAAQHARAGGDPAARARASRAPPASMSS